MLRKFSLCILLLPFMGCAVNEVYNPVTRATSGIFELNQKALKDVKVGMTQDQVHHLMGEAIVIGYRYGNASANGPEPITLKNPYKAADVVDPKSGACTVEYYATAVVVPDGRVSDEELMPLKFCSGVLVAKGWDKIK